VEGCQHSSKSERATRADGHETTWNFGCWCLCVVAVGGVVVVVGHEGRNAARSHSRTLHRPSVAATTFARPQHRRRPHQVLPYTVAARSCTFVRVGGRDPER